MDFPGGKIPFVSQMKFISESSETRLACYRVLDNNGSTISGSVFEQVINFNSGKKFTPTLCLY